MAFSLARANPVGSLKLVRRRPELSGLAGVNFLHQLAHASLPAIAVLYTSYRYGWDSQMMGLSLAAIGIMSGLVQGTLIKPIVARIGERRTLLVGLLFGAAGFAIYGVASTGLQFWAGIPVMALWGIAGAATQAMMSKLVTASSKGSAGRQRQHHGRCGSHWSGAVQLYVCLVDRARRRRAAAGPGLSAGRRFARGGRGARLAGDARRPVPRGRSQLEPGLGDLSFAISADYARLTGGFIYDHRLLQGLSARGWRIKTATLPAGFPTPSHEWFARNLRQSSRRSRTAVWCWSINFASASCPRSLPSNT